MKFQNFCLKAFVLLGFLVIPFLNAYAINGTTNEGVATPSEVFVVYNSSYATDSNSDTVQDSLEIANYYKTVRGIPNANVVGVAMPTSQDISRDDYNTYIKTGIEDALTNAGLKDTIKYIVLVKGVPLKVQDTSEVATNYVNYTGNYASVDSSVTMLYQTYSTTSKVHNPYYLNYSFTHIQNLDYRFKPNFFVDTGYGGDTPTEQTLKYLVTRLDGYTVADVKGMIDRAYSADTTGAGYYVVDNYSGSNNFSFIQGSTTTSRLNTLSKNFYPNPYATGASVKTNAPGSVIGYTGYGIYAGLPNNYYNNSFSFTYLNGAVTSTYESYASFSMTSPDTTDHGQIAQFIAAGGSGGIGNVYEPYSDAIANEEIWMPAYAAGYTWADAAYMSLAYLDWTTVVLGDPLMKITESMPPILSSITTTGTTTTGTTITWTTDEISSSSVSYGTTSSYGTTTSTTDTSPRVTSHSVSISGLTCGTTYHYKVISSDALANTTSDTDHTFSTSDCPDTTAPTITNISSSKANGTYGLTEVIDIDVTFSEAVTSTGNVTVTLETGTTDRTCTFTVSSSTTGTCDYTVQAGDTSSDLTVLSISGTINDASDNAMVSFTPATNLAANKALVIDTTSPVLSLITTTGTTTTGTTITWTTDEISSSSVSYGTTSSYGTTTSTTDTSPRVTSHSVSISGLTCGTTYHYKVISSDALANTTSDTDYTFSTDTCLSSGGGGGGGGGGFVPTPTTPVTTPSNTANPALTDAVVEVKKLDTDLKTETKKELVLDSKNITIKNLIQGGNLFVGQNNKNVKSLQQFLNAQGFVIAKSGPGSPGFETTYFGPATKKALISFQKLYRISPATGNLGPLTKTLISKMDTINPKDPLCKKLAITVKINEKACSI